MRSIRGGINQMATEDGFQPDRSPIFLSGHAEETGQPDIGKAWDMATISSRILKTSMLAAAVTAIGIAILSVGNPVALVANVTDWWVDKSALQPDADPSTSTIQSIAGTQDLPPTTDAPAREEIAAAAEPADQARPRPVRAGRSVRPGREQPARHCRQPAGHRRLVQAIPGLGGRGRRGHRPSPHRPRRLPRYGWRKMPRRRSGP